MGLLSAVVGGLGIAGSLFGANKAAKAAKQASEFKYQKLGEAADEIRSSYAPFQPLRGQAIESYGQLLDTGTSTLMQQLQQALGQGQGEAITRALSAQGRSQTGALPRAMADMSGQNYLSSLGAAQNLYNVGLGLPTGAEQIAQLYGAQGQAGAGGILGAAQAKQTGLGQALGFGLNLLGRSPFGFGGTGQAFSAGAPAVGGSTGGATAQDILSALGG